MTRGAWRAQALGLMKEVNGELQCAPMENGVTCYVPESESLDVDHSHSLDSDDLYCILPDGAGTGLDRPATLPLHAQEASAEAGTSGRAVALRGRTSFVRRRVSSNGENPLHSFLSFLISPLKKKREEKPKQTKDRAVGIEPRIDGGIGPHLSFHHFLEAFI